MKSTDSIIFRIRRDLTVAFLVKALLFVGFVGSVAVLPVYAPSVPSGLVMLAVAVLWVVLTYNSAKSARAAAEVPSLIATGRYDEAEEQLDFAVRSFSVVSAVKLQALHHLALLRHAQRRYRETVTVCQELLNRRLGKASALAKPARLLLADAMLELDDLNGAHEALAGLYGHRLALPEVLQLLASQLEYEARIGAWDRMMHEVMTKVQLAEIMPPATSAGVQALLALAAKNAGRTDFCDWLRARAELLAEPAEMTTRHPILTDLWPSDK